MQNNMREHNKIISSIDELYRKCLQDNVFDKKEYDYL